MARVHCRQKLARLMTYDKSDKTAIGFDRQDLDQAPAAREEGWLRSSICE
jgi:hypothetical protein